MEKQLRLADGTLIDTGTNKRTVSTEINKHFKPDAQPTASKADFVQGRRRFLDDLPVPYIQSKPIALIAGYLMFGLTPGDISRIINAHVDDVMGVIESADYASFMDGVLQNVREHDKNSIRKRLNDAAPKATDMIVRLSESEDEKVALKASQDILDRTGFKPSEVHEHKVEGGFVIRRISDENKKAIDVGVG